VNRLKAISIELPDEVVKLYGEKELESSVKELIVLELVRKGKLSSGKAAEILEMTKWDFMELMSSHDVPMANFPTEEIERQAKERGLI